MGDLKGRPGGRDDDQVQEEIAEPLRAGGQGFIVGAALFFATAPRDADAPNQAPPIQSAALPDSLQV